MENTPVPKGIPELTNKIRSIKLALLVSSGLSYQQWIATFGIRFDSMVETGEIKENTPFETIERLIYNQDTIFVRIGVSDKVSRALE